MSVTIVAALTMGAVSGMAPAQSPSAEVGSVLFQVFFSMAYFVVALVGPAVGANNIASEREGKTWEPLILTGFPARSMAHGKFLSALTFVLQYVAILCPVGALPFLFGGVSATEVVLAFLGLVVLCALGVGFGLAVGSSISSGRIAIVVAVIAAASLAIATYYVLGILLSKQVNDIWNVVPSGRPVWLPTALANAPLSADYVVVLILQPLVGIVVPGWFFREVTVANMTSAFKDRSSGLLRWLAGATCMLGAALAAPLVVDGANWLDATALRALLGMASFAILTTLVLQGISPGSARVGPTMVQAMARLLVFSLIALVSLTAASLVVVALRVSELFVDSYLCLIGSAGAYFVSFVVFVVGMGAWLRIRTANVATARVSLVGVVLLAVCGPFVLAVVGMVLGDESETNMVIAAPSPAYLLLLPKELTSSARDYVLVRTAWFAAGWALAGAVFFWAALRRQRSGSASGSRVGALWLTSRPAPP
jgi:ABC-type transport system involved in multi-copper enzyme maturation permease subunit